MPALEERKLYNLDEEFNQMELSNKVLEETRKIDPKVDSIGEVWKKKSKLSDSI